MSNIATAIDAPRSSKIRDTVVDVGNPRALNVLRSTTSESIIATKRIMTFSKVNICGWNTPLRATSIIPFEVSTPSRMPAAATVRIIQRFATLEPSAEFKKLMASFDTPTIRSRTASMARIATITVKKGLIILLLF